jgi:hypothetical protein
MHSMSERSEWRTPASLEQSTEVDILTVWIGSLDLPRCCVNFILLILQYGLLVTSRYGGTHNTALEFWNCNLQTSYAW